jgi:hypothetical protein
VVCPDNSKAGLKEMQAVVDTFKEGLSKMNATDLEENPEARRPYWSNRNSVKKK